MAEDDILHRKITGEDMTIKIVKKGEEQND